MYIGETLVAETWSETNTPTVVYTPWFGRQGNSATFGVELMTITADADLQVEFFMKNPEDDDAQETPVLDSTATAVNLVLTSATTSPLTGRGVDLLEWIRCKITLSDLQTAEPPNDRTVIVVYRLLPPMWETN